MNKKKKCTSRLGWRKTLGELGESHTADFLCKKGWTIVERNWRAGRYAEVDIIAFDPQKVLVFIEVKTRIENEDRVGFIDSGFDKLNQRKINKMISVSQLYISKCLVRQDDIGLGCRFDAFVLYYPSLVRQADWGGFNTIEQLISVKPEILHIKDLLA